jgi:hypothetical protein
MRLTGGGLYMREPVVRVAAAQRGRTTEVGCSLPPPSGLVGSVFVGDEQ